jgi:hypothetical protein
LNFGFEIAVPVGLRFEQPYLTVHFPKLIREFLVRQIARCYGFRISRKRYNFRRCTHEPIVTAFQWYWKILFMGY